MDNFYIFFKKFKGLKGFSSFDVLLKILLVVFFLHLCFSIITQYSLITEGFLSLIIFSTTLVGFFFFGFKILNDMAFSKTLIIREEFLNFYSQNELTVLDLLSDQLFVISSQNFLIQLLEFYFSKMQNRFYSNAKYLYILLLNIFLKNKIFEYLGIVYYQEFSNKLTYLQTYVKENLKQIFVTLLVVENY